MLNTNSDYVLQEIRDAENHRSKVLTNVAALVRRFIGNWYRTDVRGKPRPENMIFNFIATMLPELIFDNPQVSVTAVRSITHEPIAKFMQMGINGWIKEQDVRGELELLAMDMLFGFGVAVVGLEPRGDYTAAPIEGGVRGRFNCDALEPFLIRIPPQNYGRDAKCDHPQASRFEFHQYQRDLSDLQQDERFDQAIVAQLTADETKRTGSEHAGEQIAPEAKDGQPRDRVTLYDVYLRETRQLGTIAVGRQGRGDWIRPLTAYHGPQEGPFVVFGVYCVPNEVYPLSPVMAMAEQDQELNAHAQAAAKEASTQKNVTLVNADQPEVARSIENAGTNAVITVKGLNGNTVVPVPVGGTSEQRIAYLSMLLQRTDRMSGQSDAARGRAAGVTATEANLANSNADARVEFIHLKFQDATRDALTRVGWYFFYDPAVVRPVSYQDPGTGQQLEGIFMGGVQSGQEDASWTMHMLSIDPMSMRRMDPVVQQQQAQQTLQIGLTVLPLIPQMPYANWMEILDMIGQAANIPDFARKLLNQQGMMLLQAPMMQAGQMPPQPGAMQGANPHAAVGLPQNAGPGVQLAAAGAPLRLFGPARQQGQAGPGPGAGPAPMTGGASGGGPRRAAPAPRAA